MHCVVMCKTTKEEKTTVFLHRSSANEFPYQHLCCVVMCKTTKEEKTTGFLHRSSINEFACGHLCCVVMCKTTKEEKTTGFLHRSNLNSAFPISGDCYLTHWTKKMRVFGWVARRRCWHIINKNHPSIQNSNWGSFQRIDIFQKP